MNKKSKIMAGCIAAIAIATVTALNVNFSEKTNDLSDIVLTNIEALAVGEDDSVTCCPDPADTCLVGSTRVADYDEC
jgi:hypothetical protein